MRPARLASSLCPIVGTSSSTARKCRWEMTNSVQSVSQPWREAGRTELTTQVVEERLDAYVTALMDALG